MEDSLKVKLPVSDEPAARHEHIRLTVDFGRVQALDLFVIKVSYDL